jgi:superfamily II DNA or RNA helicase
MNSKDLLEKSWSEQEKVALMKKTYSYPEPDDPDFQSKIYKKREYYYHKIPQNKLMETYQDIKDYRDNVCRREFAAFSHQAVIANFINPNTPYKGLLVVHGVGTGKTCTAIGVAEQFKDMVRRYGTKIHILVPGPIIKEKWKTELIKCTKETYLKEVIGQLNNPAERDRVMNQAIQNALQYYKIISYRGFYRKVLGEKVVEKKQTEDGKTKTTYRKTAEGDVERDIIGDRIDHLNNSLLIIDEAHNVTGNEYGAAVRKIIDNSTNLRVLLLSATPMKNFADDVIELINLLRPTNDPLLREKVFDSSHNHLMKFRDGGLDYLRDRMNGYISYFRGSNPLIFAKRVEKGVIPKGLLFTRVIRCLMEPFQLRAYNETAIHLDDALDRKSGAVANIVFPAMSSDQKEITAVYGLEGINTVLSQLRNNKEKYLEKINKVFFDGKVKEDELDLLVNETPRGSISGRIFDEANLGIFSIKFKTCLEKINQLVEGKKGAGTCFVYSNLVKVGTDIFQEILLQNGYLEFQEDGNYSLYDNTRDYYTGLTYADFKQDKTKFHFGEFHPATFIVFTGKGDDGEDGSIPEDRKRLLDKIFNHEENMTGKKIKIVLGSRVLTEGTDLFNIRQIHILDVHYNLGRVEQVMGRGIRQCGHINMMSEVNPYPEVDIYKYVVALKDETLTTEEELYRKGELKYLTIKKVERVMKEIAIDCPINYHGNLFPEEEKMHRDCEKTGTCPAICDYMPCNFTCGDKNLNLKYYDKNRKLYATMTKDKLDMSTFTYSLAKNEIEYAKNKIKELYLFRKVYALEAILEHVKDSYTGEQRDLFDQFFVFKALDDLMPIDENDFNNFKDTIYDAQDRPGYLIYRNKYYIFQPFDEDEDAPMHYRSAKNVHIVNEIRLDKYIEKKYSKLLDEIGTETKTSKKAAIYDFETVRPYYASRPENDWVGAIDAGKDKLGNALGHDEFKIRQKSKDDKNRKRGTGITSFLGAVCKVAKEKRELHAILKSLGLSTDETSRDIMCTTIQNKLMMLEKYSTGKDRKTYMIVPFNHPTLKFPLNLQDRSEMVVEQIKQKMEENDIKKVDVFVSKESIKEPKGAFKYVLKVDAKKAKAIGEYLEKEHGAKLGKSDYVIVIE